MRDPAVMDTVRQLEDVNRRLAELSETLGPRNLRILELESQKAQVAAALSRQRTLVARSITREYEAALATEQSIQRELNAARTGVQMVNREEFQLASLEREAQTNRQLYDLFMSRAKETDLAGSVQASVARVVDPAVPDELAYRPARLEIVLATTLLALLAAAGASFVLDRLDKSVKGGEDAEFRLDQPVLAALPEVHGSDRRRMALLFLQDTHSHFAEAIRTLRTGVLMSSADHPHKMILVTSSLPGEGKTTVAINLALAHAQTKRTLLIDADMRRSQVDRSLRIAPGHRGLTNLVAGTANIDACVQQFTGTDLHVMSIGELPPNPLELLLSERFGEVLQELSDQFEVIIIDSPPVEMVSEALVLAPLVTSTVFVVKALSTPAALARKSLDRLQRAGGSILGLVVNQLDFGGAPRDYGEYGLYGEAAQSYLDHQEGEGGVVAARS
jgi:capsular exopolysaccharide synthesis family protein